MIVLPQHNPGTGILWVFELQWSYKPRIGFISEGVWQMHTLQKPFRIVGVLNEETGADDIYITKVPGWQLSLEDRTRKSLDESTETPQKTTPRGANPGVR